MGKRTQGGFKANSGEVIKTLIIMKLIIFFVLFAGFSVKASPITGQTINLVFHQTEIKKILNTIEHESDCRFLFNSNLNELQKKVDISFNNISVADALTNLFSGLHLQYKLQEGNLYIINSNLNNENKFSIITGRIIGENGEALSGASVIVKGTGKGTITDNNGMFSISAEPNATLLISSIGYESEEIKINNRNVIDVKLQLSVKKTDEVVVIGYGTASKRDLTGSIVKISGREIADKPNTNPVASLQGKVAGLSVVNNGTPGKAPDIRIRGTVSIGQVHPLYVVDGIFNDNIDYLNPNDIESIEVLKDPSSLAIFGVKGATGVIAITTKKAKAGQVIVNFNTSLGFKKLVDKIKMADASTFNLLFNEENANNGISTPDYSALNSNTDWIGAVTRIGKINTNNLSVSASTEKNRFNLGLGYTTDEGIVIREKLSKMLFSFSDEMKLNKAFKVGINLNATRQNLPFDEQSVLDAARKVMPQISALTKPFKVANPYGSDSLITNIYSGLNVGLQNSGVDNPVLNVENNWNKFTNIENRTVGSVYAEVQFLKNFTFRSTFYGDVSNVNYRQYNPLYYAYDPMTNMPYLYNAKTQVYENDQTWRKFQQDHILNYKRNMGNHNFIATAGLTTYYFGNFNRNATAKPYTSGNALPIPNDKRFWYINTQFNDPTTTLASSGQNEYSTFSALGRILYNFKNKYYFTASLRDDASSQIPTKNQHQKFWALGAGWELTKEEFMKNITSINFLKLKASVGVLGNQSASYLDGTPINYPFYPRLNTGAQAVFGTVGYGAATNEYEPNPDLKWETVHASEIGFELNAFNNRFHFEANYFNKKTKDLMTFVDRSSLGLKNLLENGGSIQNWGEEFSASWTQNLRSDLSINIGGNITFLKNKVLSLASDIPGGYLSRGFQNNGSAESRSIVGSPIGSFYGYVVDGIYQSYADVLASPVASSIGAYGPGDFKFKDINGDGKITADDRKIIGNPTPKFTYGTTVNVNYKNFTVGVDMGGVYGNQVFRTWGSLESPFQRVNYAAFKIERWHGAGTSNWEPIISQGHRFNYNGSTYNIEDGSYFRIRNLQVGYNFGKNMISKAKMKNLRVYVNIQNLKTWKNNKGYTSEFGGDATAFGYDNAGGAIPMITSFGLNVTF